MIYRRELTSGFYSVSKLTKRFHRKGHVTVDESLNAEISAASDIEQVNAYVIRSLSQPDKFCATLADFNFHTVLRLSTSCQQDCSDARMFSLVLKILLVLGYYSYGSKPSCFAFSRPNESINCPITISFVNTTVHLSSKNNREKNRFNLHRKSFELSVF